MYDNETLKELLDQEVKKRNNKKELNENQLDPLIVAQKYKDEYISLVCALFSYGNAKLIVKFLRNLDFKLLDESENIIREKLKNTYYRFQTSLDVQSIFIALSRLKKNTSLNELFIQEYKKNHDVLDGIYFLIENIYRQLDYTSKGYTFLVGSLTNKNSTLKRWNMYLRWMVRSDNLDMGLWFGISKSDLLLPLDTHTFRIGQNIGLLKRKTYDMKSVKLITEKLKEFDRDDPIRYDFALYRIGQENIL